jgi:hypothetical protein
VLIEVKQEEKPEEKKEVNAENGEEEELNYEELL